MIARAPHALPAYSGQRCLAKLEGHGGGFKDAITWARDSFFVIVTVEPLCKTGCFTSVGRKTETVEITAEATMNTNLYKARETAFYVRSVPSIVPCKMKQLPFASRSTTVS
jgi:hypothetical protein